MERRFPTEPLLRMFFSKIPSDLILQLKLLDTLQCLWLNIILKTGFHNFFKRKEGYQWLSGGWRMQMEEWKGEEHKGRSYFQNLSVMSPAWLVWFFLLCSRPQVFPIKTSELTLLISCRAVAQDTFYELPIIICPGFLSGDST